MPTITVQRQDLYRLAGLEIDYPLAALDEKLMLVKGELNSRTHDGIDLRRTDGTWQVDSDNYKLRIELADTNRPDLWSVEGIARHLRDHARGHGERYVFAPSTSISDSEPKRDDRQFEIRVDPQMEAIRPYVGGFLAQGGVMDEATLLAIIEAQETLTANFGRHRRAVSIGLYDGETLAWPIRYTAVGFDEMRFVPLPPVSEGENENEAWPMDLAMTPREILEQHPTGREYATILADVAQAPMLFDANDEVLSFPPIINSAYLGRVTVGMRAIFVEATGLDQDQCLLVLNILAANFQDRGWTIRPVTSNYPYGTPRGCNVHAPFNLSQQQQVCLSNFVRSLGELTTEDEVMASLHAYGVDCSIISSGSESGDPKETILLATAPPYRQDYLHAVDVIEDYAISRGYDSLTPLLPTDFTVGKLDPMTELEDLVRDLLIGFGFEEAVCNILTSHQVIRMQMDLPEDEAQPSTYGGFHGGLSVSIQNIMSRNYATLRDWVIPSLLEIESHSTATLYPHRIFEVGEVAVYEPDENLGSRTESRAAGINADEGVNFDTTQSVIYALLQSLELPFVVQPWQHPSFIPGRVARLTGKDGQPIGFLGELSPQVLTNWGIRVPISAFEITVNALHH
ncbi:phenylalanine--tRNA ligase subunit beta [Chloroflexi bacterium TSY]|nr:phenylalanine--tRNA ligase subunit beta [Chloroflexi bacterium TSY]